jgi:hypothetical protein
MVPADGDAATLSVQLPLGSGQPALTKAVPFKLTKERPGLQHATFELAGASALCWTSSTGRASVLQVPVGEQSAVTSHCTTPLQCR